MTWEPKGLQKLLFRHDERGWYWTRRAVAFYTFFGRITR